MMKLEFIDICVLIKCQWWSYIDENEACDVPKALYIRM